MVKKASHYRAMVKRTDSSQTISSLCTLRVAHPIRRGIVERLARGPATVGVVTRGFGVSKPTISKHLKVLERAGVVVRTVEGRTHQLELNVVPLIEAADWFDRQRVVWTRMFDAVDDLLREQKKLP
jgi:DNA-binding transcriptional ArsR family regulator